jgi:NAD(P)-dependent dehydrogenase (short-subunit alcohol dehydrogenase family)
MKLISAVAFLSLVGFTSGLLLPSKKQATSLCRKGFLVGAAGAVVVGTATAAGAAVAINSQVNSKSVYEPAPGSLDGQLVLITGASSGLGLESAKRLAAAGATIVMTSRNAAKGEKAVESVKEYLNNKAISNIPMIYSLVLDLDDLENVKSFPGSFKALGLGDISVLINNAGVMAIPDRQLTKDGYERTFQSNHLGHFVLTAELFPFLSRKGAKVINVSSEAFQFAGGGLDLDNLNGEKEYGAWSSYGLSKLANILFTQELQRRADEAGESWLTTVTLHPGAVSTDLGRNLVGEEKWNDLKTKGPSGLESLALNALSLFTKTVPEGASTQIFLAAGADGSLKKGAFYEDLKEKKNMPKFTTDEAKAKALWEQSEVLGGIKFDPTSTATSTATSAAASTVTSISSSDDEKKTEA